MSQKFMETLEESKHLKNKEQLNRNLLMQAI
jgi:hypothetical protein